MDTYRMVAITTSTSKRKTSSSSCLAGKKILRSITLAAVFVLPSLFIAVNAFPVTTIQQRRRRTRRRDSIITPTLATTRLQQHKTKRRFCCSSRSGSSLKQGYLPILMMRGQHCFPSPASSSSLATTTSLSSASSSSSSSSSASSTTTTVSSSDSSSSSSSSTTSTRSDAVIERVFSMLDSDNSGTITIDELTEFLQGKARSEYSNKDVNTVFNNIDADESGCLSFEEFRKAMLSPGNNNGEEAEESLSCIVTQNAIADMVFMMIDKDNSGTIDFDELVEYLAPSASLSPTSSSSEQTDEINEDADSSAIQTSINTAERTKQEITTLFSNMDQDNDGTISMEEFRWAMVEECPRGYFIDSVDQVCKPLGPLGRMSQKVEVFGVFRKAYKSISTVFGLDHARIQKLGVSFALSYSIISNLNGAVSFSVAWYISCKRTGMSPLVPGQWKSLMRSYGMVYGLIQLLKPFRVAAAIGMSKLSAEYLEMTQTKLNCKRGTAILCQYLMGVVMMCCSAFLGVSIVSYLTGVPMFG